MKRRIAEVLCVVLFICAVFMCAEYGAIETGFLPPNTDLCISYSAEQWENIDNLFSERAEEINTFAYGKLQTLEQKLSALGVTSLSGFDTNDTSWFSTTFEYPFENALYVVRVLTAQPNNEKSCLQETGEHISSDTYCYNYICTATVSFVYVKEKGQTGDGSLSFVSNKYQANVKYQYPDFETDGNGGVSPVIRQGVRTVEAVPENYADIEAAVYTYVNASDIIKECAEPVRISGDECETSVYIDDFNIPMDLLKDLYSWNRL